MQPEAELGLDLKLRRADRSMTPPRRQEAPATDDDYLDSYLEARNDGQNDASALLCVANSAGETVEDIRSSLVRQVRTLLPLHGGGDAAEARLQAYLHAWENAGAGTQRRMQLLLSLTPPRDGASGSEAVPPGPAPALPSIAPFPGGSGATPTPPGLAQPAPALGAFRPPGLAPWGRQHRWRARARPYLPLA